MIDAVQIEHDRLASQQVFNLDITHLVNLDRAAQEFAQAGNHPNLDGNLLTDRDDAANIASRGLRDGEDDMIDFKFPHQSRQLGGGGQDSHALHQRASLVPVVVDKPLDEQINIAARFDFSGGQHSRAPRANQQDRLGPPCSTPGPTSSFVPLVVDASQQSHAYHAAKTEGVIHNDD